MMVQFCQHTCLDKNREMGCEVEGLFTQCPWPPRARLGPQGRALRLRVGPQAQQPRPHDAPLPRWRSADGRFLPPGRSQSPCLCQRRQLTHSETANTYVSTAQHKIKSHFVMCRFEFLVALDGIISFHCVKNIYY